MKKSELIRRYTFLWEKEAHKCSKCGKCRSFCPVFISTRDEKMGTRGRVSLAAALASNQIYFTPEFVQSISTCMRCLRCSKECPSKVDFDKIIRAVRGVVGKNVLKYRIARNAIGIVLNNRRLLDFLAFAGFYAQKFLPRGDAGWVKKLPFFYRGSAVSPRISKYSGIKRYAGDHKVNNPKYRVMFYVGCMINYVYPGIAEAVIDVLNHFGVEVVVSNEELCCGIPSISSGDFETAKKLAIKNIEIAERLKVDCIIGACGTCVNTFKKDYPELVGKGSEEFCSKAIDISVFLKNVLKAEIPRIDVKTTYHDPCHLRFGLNITQEPRGLLSSATKYKEMKNADKCCGMAGSFGIINCDLSKKIFAEKVEAVRGSGAKIVATGCPSCVMQLRGQLTENGINIEVLHTIEILRRAITGGRIGRDSKKEPVGAKN